MTAEAGLDRVTAAELRGVPHGFFGRRGGVSGGVWASLNCGPGSADAAEAVAENRRRVAAAMGAPPDRLLFARQSHTATVATAGGPWPDGAAPQADALVTAAPGLVLAVMAADCAPVLLADREARVIGAAHAGWRGALAGVLEATLDAMEAIGAARGRVRAAIGPCISQRSYEVGPEFFDAFTLDDPEAARFFAGGPAGRPMFDLPGYALARLRAAGVAEAGWTRHCTYAEPERFHSCRRAAHREEADYGRLASAIALP